MRAVAITTLGLWLFWSSVCRAEAPSACDERTLRAEARRARTWRYSWTAVNGALTVGSFVAIPLVDSEEHPDYIVGGISSGVNTLTTWFMPLRVEGAEDELDAMPAAERPRHIRRLVLESAEDERDRVSWPWHLANIGLAAIPGAIIAFGYDHYASGLLTTLVGVGLGEAQLLTQPTGLPLSCASTSGFTWAPRFSVLRGPRQSLAGGLVSLNGTF